MQRKKFDGVIKIFVLLSIFSGSFILMATNAYATGGFGYGWDKDLAWAGFLFVTVIQILVSLLYFKKRGLFPIFLICCLFYSFIFGWFCYGIIFELYETTNKGIIGFNTYLLFYYLFLLVLVSFKWSQEDEIRTAIHRTLAIIFIVLFCTWLFSPHITHAWAYGDGDKYWIIPAGSGLWGPFNVGINVLNPITTSILAVFIIVIIFIINSLLYQATTWITSVYRVTAQTVLCAILIVGLKVIFEPPLLGVVSKYFVDPKQILATKEDAKFNECVRWSEYYGMRITEHDVAKHPGYPIDGGDNFADAYLRRAQINMKSNNYEKALSDYTNSIRLIPREDEDKLGYVNNYVESAWLYATFHDEKIRNGNRAVELAKKAIEASGLDLINRTVDQLIYDPNNCQGWTSDLAFPAMLLEVLAAAYAEANDFEHATEAQEKSLNLMIFSRPENVNVQNLLKEQLETYKANKPWRQFSNSLNRTFFVVDGHCDRIKRMQEKQKD